MPTNYDYYLLNTEHFDTSVVKYVNKAFKKMKNIITVLLIAIVCSLTAQKVEYGEGKIMYDGEQIQTIDVILNPSVSTIKDKFSDWIDDNFDVNLDGKKLLFFNREFLTAEGVIIPQVSTKKIDLHVKVDETQKGNTILHVFASYGYNNWITSELHSYAYDSLKGIVYDFVSDYLPEYYYERIEQSQENIEDLEEDNEDIEKDLADNKKEIDDILKKNEELRSELEENKSKLKKANERLNTRQNEYQKVKKKVSGME